MLQHKFHQIRPHHHWHCLFREYLFFTIFNWYNKHYPPTHMRERAELSQKTHFVSGTFVIFFFVVTEHFWMVRNTHEIWILELVVINLKKNTKSEKQLVASISMFTLSLSCQKAFHPHTHCLWSKQIFFYVYIHFWHSLRRVLKMKFNSCWKIPFENLADFALNTPRHMSCSLLTSG